MKQLFVFLFLLCSIVTSAQDVIVKNDGSTIVCKIMEVDTTEVKYIKWGNQDDSICAITKADILIVNYENGEKRTYPEIENIQLCQQYSNNGYSAKILEQIMVSNLLFKEKMRSSAKNWRFVGDLWFWLHMVGGISSGVITYASGLNESICWIIIGGSLVSGFIGAGICTVIARNKERAANSIASVPLIIQEFDLGKRNLSASINIMNDRVQKNKAVGLGLCINF